MKQILLRVAIFGVLAVLFSIPAVYAAVPHLIRYQGMLKDAQGVPLEGPYTLTFRLYAAESGGTTLWTEQQDAVPLSSGSFSVILGQVEPLDAVDWGSPLWLSIQVNGDSELAPRQRITSVPLAIRAETAEIVKTSGLTDDANSLVPAGAIILWDGASCPAGYTRLSAYDDKFIVGSATAATTGGSSTHSHGVGTYAGPSHTHQLETGSVYGEKQVNPAGMGDVVYANANGFLGSTSGGQGGGSVTGAIRNLTTLSGNSPITGSSAAADSRPQFRTILLCKRN